MRSSASEARVSAERASDREAENGLSVLCGAAVVAFAVLALNACGIDPPQKLAVAGGDEVRGRDAIDRYGCGSCHAVPGIASARGQVGPPLDHIAQRSYVGGILPNTPDNMVAWICRPQSFAPGTAMPDLGISEATGRDIAAYLYTLR